MILDKSSHTLDKTAPLEVAGFPSRRMFGLLKQGERGDSTAGEDLEARTIVCYSCETMYLCRECVEVR